MKWPSTNLVVLTGKVGRVKKVSYGDGWASFHVAVATRRLIADPTTGKAITSLDWHNVVIPGVKRLAKFEEEVQAGAIIQIQGRLHMRAMKSSKYPGMKAYFFDIYCDLWELIRSREDQETWEDTRNDTTQKVKHESTRESFAVFDQHDSNKRERVYGERQDLDQG